MDNNPTMGSTPSRYLLAPNLANINNIERMWRAQWPEFSWLTDASDPTSRLFQMFAPDISRVGYGKPNDAGDRPVYSIMCPQQGIWIPGIEGTLNIEVTVTQSGGIVNEGVVTDTNPGDKGNGENIDAQMSIQPKIWFSPDTMQNNLLIQLLWDFFKAQSLPFPSSKENAILLNASGVLPDYTPTNTDILDVKTGRDPMYTPPPFAMHDTPDEYGMVAWSTAFVAVQIGSIVPTGHFLVDAFNALVMDIFNYASGNLLQEKNILSWNVWVNAPEEVYTEEWEMHANYWRFSLDVNHRSPDGSGRNPKKADTSDFKPALDKILDKVNFIKNLLVDKAPLPENLNAQFDAVANKQAAGEVKFL